MFSRIGGTVIGIRQNSDNVTLLWDEGQAQHTYSKTKVSLTSCLASVYK